MIFWYILCLILIKRVIILLFKIKDDWEKKYVVILFLVCSWIDIIMLNLVW